MCCAANHRDEKRVEAVDRLRNQTMDPRRKQTILLSAEYEDEKEEQDMPLAPAATASVPTTTTTSSNLQTELRTGSLTQPSPFPQHFSSTRFRNALARVTEHPESDVEAWQAFMTEVQTAVSGISLSNILPHDVATVYSQLDWVEGCYGTLLQYFPYSVVHVQAIMELLLTQATTVSAAQDLVYTMSSRQRALQCAAKLQRLFQTYLIEGDNNEDSTAETDVATRLCVWNVELWLIYIDWGKHKATEQSYLISTNDERERFLRKETINLYETALAHAGFGHNNQVLWKQYLQYIKSWTTSTPAAEQEQMIQLRSVYQRLVTHPMTGLDQLWQEYEAFERAHSEALAQALIPEFSPKYQHARTVYLERARIYNTADLQLTRLATPPVMESDDEEYQMKLQEEIALLTVWKTRCSYERTNPERLTHKELEQRIEYVFKEMACVLTRHPESWHMWSMWEQSQNKFQEAIAVLQRGQEHIPDCTLLALAEAQLVETQSQSDENASEVPCIKVIERFLERSPNTLGFVVYEQLVRRYKGMDAARAVFAKARRVLAEDEDTRKVDEKVITKVAEGGEGEPAEQGVVAKHEDDAGSRWIVTNRLNPSIGSQKISAESLKNEGEMNGFTKEENTNTAQLSPAAVTWHLYASHALIEHRLNHLPNIAARVYELGLRKHASFLTKPPYVLRYAQLLLEMKDPINLRALLTRAVAACEAISDREALATLWDMTLYFESILSGKEKSSTVLLLTIERKRREALMGPDVEDVATGGLVGIGELALIGAQKSTISEQLIRTEGYDVSSKIVNGLSRAVDQLEVMGLWGRGTSGAFESSKSASKVGENSGGKSDITLQKRLEVLQRMNSGTSEIDGDGSTGVKILSTRERLQQSSTATGGVVGQTNAMIMAIQQSPEWLRPLLLLLPASRLRLSVVAKAPPHLTEMALTAIRNNQLPDERPADDLTSDTRKRTNMDGDSSDEENGGMKKGGYGNHFRSRQRVRISGLDQNGMLVE